MTTVVRDAKYTNVITTGKHTIPIKNQLPANRTGREGQILYNNADRTFYGHNGTEFIPFGGGGNLIVEDPHWFPWNNQNDTGLSGVGNGAGADNLQLLGIGGFRLFGENISELTEVEVIPTSSASGTDGGVVSTGAGVYPTFTSTFTAASGETPAYITITPDVNIPINVSFWIRGRNPGGNWVPAPIIAIVLIS